MHLLYPISTKTVKIKTFSRGIWVASMDVVLKVCEDGDDLYSHKNKLSCKFALLYKTCYHQHHLIFVSLFSLSSVLRNKLYPPPSPNYFYLLMQFSPALILKLIFRSSKSKPCTTSLWSYFSEPL